MEGTSTLFDSHLDALGHVDRRQLLVALLDANSGNDLPVEIDNSERGTGFQLSMYHIHLPKLQNYGFVDADLDRYVVTTGPRFEEIRPFLELLDANRSRLPDGWLSQPRRPQ